MGLHSLRGGRNELYIFGKGQGKEMEAQLIRKIKKVMDLLRVNWQTMAEFEILYKVLSLTIFTPLFLWVFNGIMKVTGYQYLTIENVFSFLLNPLTLLALLLLAVCMAVYSMVDIGAVIFLLDQSYQGKKQIWCRR